MSTFILWKEYRQQRAMWISVLLLGVILALTLAATLARGGILAAGQDSDARPVLFTLIFALAIGYGVACGAMLLAGEKDDGTCTFLDMQARARFPLWRDKLMAGILFTAAQGLALGIVAVCLQLGPWSLLVFVVGAALDALIAGLVGGALCATVLTAVLTGVALVGGFWFIALILPGGIVAKVVLDGVVLYLAYRRYCEPDIQRRTQTAGAASTKPASSSSVRSYAWLFWQQGRLVLLPGLILCIAGGVLLNFDPVRVWVLGTTLIGLACGLATWAGEQTGYHFQFLGARRMPPGRFWMAKIFFWAICCLLLLTLFGATGVGTNLFAQAQRGESRRPEILRFLATLFSPTVNTAMLLGLIWPVHGFCIGQFWSLAMRRTILAIILSVFSCVLVLGLWIPSVVNGGLLWWQVMIAPAMLLLASRLTLWAWFGNRLWTWRPLALLGVLFALGIAWQSAMLWYRSVEVPDTGPVVDLVAFDQELRELEQSETGRLTRFALHDMGNRLETVDREMGTAKEPLVADKAANWPAAKADNLRWAVPAIEHGWPEKDERLRAWLDAVFAGNWSTDLGKALAKTDGMIDLPRSSLSYGRTLEEIEHCRNAVLLLRLRAMMLHQDGKDEAALQQIEQIFRLSSMVRSHAIVIVVLTGVNFETQGLMTLQYLVNQDDRNTELRRSALKLISDHRASIPDPADSLKTEYAILRERIDQGHSVGLLLGPDHWLARILPRMMQVPWERQRDDRLLRAMFHAQLDRLKIPIWKQKELPVQVRSNRPWHPGAWEVGMQFLQGSGSELSLPTWNDLIQDSFVGLAFSFGNYVAIDEFAVQSESQLRAMEQVLALMSYRQENGKFPANMQELTPKLLATVPMDPFTGEPFEFKISKGETVQGEFFDKGGSDSRVLPNGQPYLIADWPRVRHNSPGSRIYLLPNLSE